MKITKILFAASVIIAWTFLVVLFTGTYLNSHGKNNGNNSLGSGNLSNQNSSNPEISTIQLTSAEVAKHNSISDCWMIINNKVYDVTSFISSHPGGVAEIGSGCGIDATQLFNTKGGRGAPHSSTADALLANYYIGDLNQNIASSQLQNKTSSAANATVPNIGREQDNERD